MTNEQEIRAAAIQAVIGAGLAPLRRVPNSETLEYEIWSDTLAAIHCVESYIRGPAVTLEELEESN